MTTCALCGSPAHDVLCEICDFLAPDEHPDDAFGNPCACYECLAADGYDADAIRAMVEHDPRFPF